MITLARNCTPRYKAGVRLSSNPSSSEGMRRLFPPLVMLTMAALLAACPERPTKDPENPGGADGDGGECVCECDEPAPTSSTGPGAPAPEPK